MTNKARADMEGAPPAEESQEHESWLREAVRAPQATRLPKTGDLIGGKYRVEDLLGRGGMGVVFRARHVVSEKPVAVKLMLRPATDEQARRRFDREARAAGRIDHPNVVTLYDVGEEGDCSYLVMELLRGESLRHRLGRGPVEPGEALDLLIPAMRGVAAAHRAGVVHRDLKPDNIFLCEQSEGGPGAAKVLDFGISSISSLDAADSTLTQEGTLLGSLAYMSPEQLRSPHDVDARTDVYALGVILYEVLTGELPFQGVSHSALIVAIATTAPKRLSQVRASCPAGLEDVVLRALARDRDERYPGMNSLIDALLPFAPARQSAGVPVIEAPQRRSPESGQSPSTAARVPASAVRVDTGTARLRSRSRLALIGAVLLLLAGLFTFMALRSAAPPLAEPALPAPVRFEEPKLANEAPAAQPMAPAPARAPDSAPAPAPAVRAAALAAQPAPTAKAVKPLRARAARSKAVHPRPGSPEESTAESKESSLFSGRK